MPERIIGYEHDNGAPIKEPLQLKQTTTRFALTGGVISGLVDCEMKMGEKDGRIFGQALRNVNLFNVLRP
jgi:hypothetical protein